MIPCYQRQPQSSRVFKIEQENHLPSTPGQLLAGDITYLRLKGSFLYLAVVLDLYNREVVGWSISSRLQTSLVIQALDDAINKVGLDSKVVFHSDQGCQYTSEEYRNYLMIQGIQPSLSRRGNCYDNAYVESWFSSLKKEWIDRHDYHSEEQLKSLVFEYIEVWYNRKRIHSALGYQSPLMYKNQQRTA